MLQIFIGSIILSITHALIPNHWFPLVAISKSEKWTRRETLLVTAITGFAHITSTIIIGIIVGFVGYKLSDSLETITGIIAPSVLMLFGIVYLVLNFVKPHHHHHHINSEDLQQSDKKSKLAIVFSFGALMFFSPCIEIEAYYFTAGSIGWAGILILSFVYLVVTVSFMIFLVDFGRRSLERLSEKLHFLDKYERAIAGMVLILLGLFTHFVKL
ncbi:MAG: sulfite exporter TauE/SafE family protein [Ignavibacteriae bacterium]|nr:sulfite exporter TauE/SafE family protein [Ignavibacteriota bacterium]